MDFFQAQNNARKKTGRLIFFYLAAVIGIILTIYVIVVFLFARAGNSDALGSTGGNTGNFIDLYWQPELFLGTALITAAVIGLGSLFKSLSLRGGGGVVARSVGGRQIPSNTSDPQYRRLLNIVEEMSIAAGIRMPEVYVLPEAGLNAFAAGYSPDDAAVAVTQGALDTLSRDELQGVVAHEFSHILNGDMRLNIRLIGLLFGILLLTILGRVIMRAGLFSDNRRSSRDNKGGAAAIGLLGLGLVIVGWIGVVFGRLIQAAVSRQREFLADASAVQFTRNPDGISGALKKIGLASAGSRIANAHATETSHMFFSNAMVSSFGGLFATHPPLADRIKAIDPSFNGDFRSASKATAAYRAPSPSPKSVPPPLPASSSAFLAALATASEPDSQRGAAVLEAIPAPLRDAAHDPERARAILLALLYARANAAAAAKQDATIAGTLTPNERVVLIEAARQIDAMPPWARLPLGDIALASMRRHDPAQVDALLRAIDEFIDADGEVSVYEYALRIVIRRNLRPPGRPGVLAKTCDALAKEIATLLSAIAHAGSSSPVAVQHAFDAGAAALGEMQTRVTLQNSDQVTSQKIITALQHLDLSVPLVKQSVLTAMAHTAAADGQIEPAEQDMLRAVASALNCPAPVFTA